MTSVLLLDASWAGPNARYRLSIWIKKVAVKDRLAVDVLLDELDLGEAETIVLARELNADWVLMDERKGRRKVAELGIQKIGTIGILLKAK
jgi:predicted nucleic acid-binding protein